MRLGLLAGAAALTIAGAAAAQAETIYVPGADVVTTAPDYVYAAPAPGYVVAPPPVIAEPAPSYVVVAPQPTYVAPPSYVVSPPAVVRPVPRTRGIVTTAYSSSGCFIDLRGIERCY